MKRLVLVFSVLSWLGATAIASDIAFWAGTPNTDGWYSVTEMNENVATIIAQTGHLFKDVQQFNDSQVDALGAWVEENTDDGEVDILWLNGTVPNVLYTLGNAQAEGSRIELFLDAGNMIINVGDWFGYCSYEGGARRSPENGGTGAANILDLSSGIIVSADNTSMTVTDEGHQYLPSLPATVISYRPIVLSTIVAPWEVAAVFAQTSAGTQADPLIIHNTATGGYVAFINQAAGGAPPGWLADRGLTCAELILNWVNTVIGLSNPSLAADPVPDDGTMDVPQDTALSWTAGDYAATHDVYFGASFEDVNNASRADPRGVLVSQDQADAAFDPDGLFEFGQTYYWRIDEVNGAPDNTIFKGQTWSFTAEPFSYPVTPVAATASSAQPGMSPQNTINGSGLNADDQHGVEPTTMWTSTGALPAWIQYEFDKTYQLDKMLVWNSNQLVEAFIGLGAKSVTVEYSADGATWTALEGVLEFAKGPGAATYAANTTVDLGGITAKFVKLTISANWGGMAPQTGLAEVRFFYIPVQAFYPEPADGATDVSVETELDWRPGREAASHQVSIGTDEAAVAGGTVGGETVTGHGYTPAGLLLGTEYFWKVDEVGDAGTYAGDVWSFTTEEYAVVENFESYTDDDGNRIYQAWIDGLTDSKSGSQVGYNEAPFAEQSVVHGGSQAMPLLYDNTSFAFSEATLTFDTAQDWAARGIKSLSVHFAGAAGNTGQLYVKINNTKIAYDGDATDLARAGWQAWNIDLATAGNVQSVKSLTIGVEGSGAKGTLYLDDIRLSPKAPAFVTPAEPPAANLIARYALDGNVQDSSGKGRNGTANGGPTFGPGVEGQALKLDGVDDFVVVGSVGVSGAAPRTISGWVKADTLTITDWTNLFGFTSTPNSGNALSFDMNKRGGANQYCIHAYGWEQNIMAIDLEWHHLAATYDGTTVVWYGDGQRVGSEARVLDTQDNVQMGKRGHAAGGNFPGSIDEVRIYNTALSAEEIAWLAGRRLPIHQPL